MVWSARDVNWSSTSDVQYCWPEVICSVSWTVFPLIDRRTRLPEQPSVQYRLVPTTAPTGPPVSRTATGYLLLMLAWKTSPDQVPLKSAGSPVAGGVWTAAVDFGWDAGTPGV